MRLFWRTARNIGACTAMLGFMSAHTAHAMSSSDKQKLAALVACQVEDAPNQSDSEEKYNKFLGQRKEYLYDMSYYAEAAPLNYACAKGILRGIASIDAQQAYCALLGRGLGPVGAAGQSRGLSSSVFDGDSSGDEDTDYDCSDLSSADGFLRCAQHKKEESQRQASRSGQEVKRFCESIGISLDAPRTQGRYQAGGYQRAGIVSGGNPCYSTGGLTVIKEPAWATLMKGGLSYLNNRMSIDAMKYASHDAQTTARLIANNNKDLGFPTVYGSGTSGTGGINYLGGQFGGQFGYGLYGQQMPCNGQIGVYGQGGCGGYYSGINAQLGFNTGLAGGCPYGACYGNGGIVVGGGGGGSCGVPPYSAGGCGGGIYGGAYRGPAGYGGYGGLGGYGGVGGYGGAGGGYGLPGPYGTSNGGNGWAPGGYYGNNSPWGQNGQYGQAPFWGSNGMNAQMMAQQQQMWQQFQQFQQSYQLKQDRYSAQYARLYQKRLDEIGQAGAEAGQYYQGFQNTSGGYYGTNSQQGGGGYYPPYNSQCSYYGGC